MFSQLGALFRTSLRQAQSVDIAPAIRSDFHNDRGGRGKQEPEDEPSMLWDDRTEVSLVSLKVFLTSLLPVTPDSGTETTGSGIFGNMDAIFQTQAGTMQNTPATPKLARAARAYAATAAHTEPLPVDVHPETSLQELNLKQTDDPYPTDMEKVRSLIVQIDVLAAQGVHTLTLEKSDNFLDSIIKSVEAARLP